MEICVKGANGTINFLILKEQLALVSKFLWYLVPLGNFKRVIQHFHFKEPVFIIYQTFFISYNNSTLRFYNPKIFSKNRVGTYTAPGTSAYSNFASRCLARLTIVLALVSKVTKYEHPMT